MRVFFRFTVQLVSPRRDERGAISQRIVAGFNDLNDACAFAEGEHDRHKRQGVGNWNIYVWDEQPPRGERAHVVKAIYAPAAEAA